MKAHSELALWGGLLAAATVAACLARSRRRLPALPRTQAMRLSRAAGTLAACVLCDSAVEHYRGAFHNKAMIAPLVSSSLSAIASAHAARRSASREAAALRRSAHGLALVTGIAGMVFHVYNIRKRIGGFSWQNLFYAAPFGAPAALSLAGVIGLAAERTRILHARGAGRVLAGISSLGLAGTVAEVGLLHLRGAFHNPAMYLPVSVPPVAALALAGSAVDHSARRRPFTRWSLGLTTLLGWIGSALHVFGVSRGMGGWRNWRQNLLNGPPIPAPPSFSALAAIGLVALDMIESDDG